MKRNLYQVPTPEDRTVIIPEDVYLALEGKAEEEAKRMAGKDAVSDDHLIARLITAKSLAQKVLRNFAEKKCGEYYTPSKDPGVRGKEE